MEIRSTVDLEELSWAISQQLTYEELLEFIIGIDSMVCDWDFTERLYKWAKAQHKEYKEEKKEFDR